MPLILDKIGKIEGLVCAVSTPEEGNMAFTWGEAKEVSQNRRQFLRPLGIGVNEIVSAGLEHGQEIRVVGQDEQGDTIKADALVTAEPGVFLFLCLGDCLGLAMYDPEQEVCLLAHAGYRGVDMQLPGKCVRFLQEHFAVNPVNLLVACSPALEAEHSRYKNFVFKDKADWQSWLQEDETDMFRVDWVGYAQQQLRDAGVLEQNLAGVPFSTYGEHFSHHFSRDKTSPEGRLGIVLGKLE